MRPQTSFLGDRYPESNQILDWSCHLYGAGWFQYEKLISLPGRKLHTHWCLFWLLYGHISQSTNTPSYLKVENHYYYQLFTIPSYTCSHEPAFSAPSINEMIIGNYFQFGMFWQVKELFSNFSSCKFGISSKHVYSPASRYRIVRPFRRS